MGEVDKEVEVLTTGDEDEEGVGVLEMATKGIVMEDEDGWGSSEEVGVGDEEDVEEEEEVVLRRSVRQ